MHPDLPDRASAASKEERFNSTFLARIALEWKLLRQEQLNEALRFQEDARARGRDILLGQILVERGFVRDADLERLLQEQRKRLDADPGLSRYEIRQRVGEGATAVVYHAWDREENRPVALKLLREEVSLDPLGRERFQREVAAARTLSHPNLVTVYASGIAGGRPFLVMELVKGRSFSELLKQRRPAERESAGLLEQASRGAAAAHAAGIIHRDLKPANLLVTGANQVKVTDFGLARATSGKAITAPGSALGTPMYMAPELVSAKEATARADVYALGTILYEALTGTPPHVGRNVMEIYRKTMLEEAVPPARKNPKVEPQLDGIVMKALQKAPEARYEDAGALADDLQRYLGTA
ncbi:MAG TPA: serine/threonine-protein kinase [Planctomycetota bacterium]|nr:serine/threonine-protein kinase [Planctomycetota bacterium]